MSSAALAPSAADERERAPGFRLLNEFQRGFPLVPAPFAVLAGQLGVAETQVIRMLSAFLAVGTVSRVGAVFAPLSIGVSTLAALRVPAGRLEQVAGLVSARPEVNHNYEREGDPNLWFVLNAEHDAALDAALRAIEGEAGCGSLLRLPLLEEYRIDLGFDLRAAARTVPVAARRAAGVLAPGEPRERALMAALQRGLPLVPAPYRALGDEVGMEEAQVLACIRAWIEAGAIRRFGVIVRHRELGYRANAMAVWDVPDQAVTAAGRALALQPDVTLCYRRARVLPDWPYNLYCMVHGRRREEVQQRLRAIGRVCRLDGHASRVLFSRTCYKQRGARHFAGQDDGPRSA